MDNLQPLGKVYQAGTFSGNPVTMAGGIAILELLSGKIPYEIMEERTARLFAGMQETIDRRGLPVQLQRLASMFGILFADKPVKNYQDSLKIDAHRFAKFFHHLLSRGVYLPPSAVDAACVSAAHTPDDIEQTIDVANDALKSLF